MFNRRNELIRLHLSISHKEDPTVRQNKTKENTKLALAPSYAFMGIWRRISRMSKSLGTLTDWLTSFKPNKF